jgi:Tol biopolymer transport system component
MWSRDDRHIYFTASGSSGSGPGALVMRVLTVGETDSRPFDNPGGLVHFDDQTPDGRYLVMKSPAALGSAVWIQRVDDSTDRRALVRGQFNASQARVSPDGRLLAFTIQLPSGSQVFVQRFDRPGDRIQVSTKRAFGPIWNDTGHELFYETDDSLMAVSVTEHGDTLEAGIPQKLFPLHTQGIIPNLPHNVEVAEHGQRFLVNRILGDSNNVPLEVTLNWTAGLKK